MTKREKYEAGAATPEGAKFLACCIGEGWECVECPSKLHKVCDGGIWVNCTAEKAVDRLRAFCRDWLAKHPAKSGPSKAERIAELEAEVKAKDAENAKLREAYDALSLNYSSDRIRLDASLEDTLAENMRLNRRLNNECDDNANLRARLSVTKPATRYPWERAPDWAICAATDENGWRRWYEHTPIEGNAAYRGALRSELIPTPDWRGSLEYRPGYKPEGEEVLEKIRAKRVKRLQKMMKNDKEE